MRIAITGGSGGIGRAITKLALARGDSVVSIDRVDPAPGAERANLSFVKIDIAQYDDVEQVIRGCDALVHMAAIPTPGQHPDHVVHNTRVPGVERECDRYVV